ncbi:phosphohydrolase, partial [Candidatus Kaiserbacteria bacterium CG17_big_fil_post_rev_8_21_14_2_50_51_7]
MSTFWIQTYTGKVFDLAEPKEEMVDIVDIAHALSQMCRFTGHSDKPYSVSE